MAVTGIDRKWSMFINKLRWREELLIWFCSDMYELS
jgi:hypothetical protein